MLEVGETFLNFKLSLNVVLKTTLIGSKKIVKIKDPELQSVFQESGSPEQGNTSLIFVMGKLQKFWAWCVFLLKNIKRTNANIWNV